MKQGHALILLILTAFFWSLGGLMIWFLKEYPRRIDWLAVGFALAGMVLFFFDHISLAGMWGNLFGVAAGITFAWLILFLR